MKKRTEIQQDLKRGFGSIPIGIKILVKWLLVGFVAYVAVRFVCAFVGGMVTSLGGILPTLAVLAVVVFLIRLSMAHLFHCPYPFSFFSFSSSFSNNNSYSCKLNKFVLELLHSHTCCWSYRYHLELVIL